MRDEYGPVVLNNMDPTSFLYYGKYAARDCDPVWEGVYGLILVYYLGISNNKKNKKNKVNHLDI